MSLCPATEIHWKALVSIRMCVLRLQFYYTNFGTRMLASSGDSSGRLCQQFRVLMSPIPGTPGQERPPGPSFLSPADGAAL